jgi:hypothetical protein
MGEVVYIGGWTKLPVPSERVLDAAKKFENVLVLAWDDDGLLYAATSDPDLHSNVCLAQKFVHKAMNGDYDGQD